MFQTSLTPEEQFRIHGTLPSRVIESLLDGRQSLTKLEHVDVKIKEAKGCFIGEDFLSEHLNALRALVKAMRASATKDELLGLVELLDEEVSEARQSAEYGASELRDALSALKEANLGA